AGNYDQLWLTTSLRGLAGGTLRVRVLQEGVHSGDASGIVPSSFRIMRQLLDRIEDPASGQIKIDLMHVEIPDERINQAREAASVLGGEVYGKFPWQTGMQPVSQELTELVLNRTWRPALAVTGVDGMPTLLDAGNVLRPQTAVKLSLRLPPTLSGEVASRALKETLEKDPPYGAKVEFEVEKSAQGWAAPATVPWLRAAVNDASATHFGPQAAAMGEGGTIPFMNMLQERFPLAQFMVTGLLGPKSNAHGPNEFLHIPTGKKLTACVADVLHKHYVNRGAPSVADAPVQ
ncbi:MAG: M20/M25/M40 family metallo-hydrolase, partial [Xanthomonadales bacterium]|nr:M20/M25/M40 family metallo-hydrolase [Xanthomonadales bacterium]